jgi:hypothetical protein
LETYPFKYQLAPPLVQYPTVGAVTSYNAFVLTATVLPKTPFKYKVMFVPLRTAAKWAQVFDVAAPKVIPLARFQLDPFEDAKNVKLLEEIPIIIPNKFLEYIELFPETAGQ